MARQLFLFTVCPIVDYASAIWSHKISIRTLGLAQQINRIGACTIIAGFCSILRQAAEVEAAIWPVEQRWERQRRRFWVDLHTLPPTHPLWRIIRASQKRPRRFPSPLFELSIKARDLELDELECIDCFCRAP